MQINNETLYDFIHCPYKAYKKSKQQAGTITDYEILYNQLKQTQKNNFEKTLSPAIKPIPSNTTFDIAMLKEAGIGVNLHFKNSTINLMLDGIEFTGKKNVIPIFITPFEKVTKLDKLFVALQATLIQDEFNLEVEYSKVVFGKNIRQTKFKLSSFTKTTKKILGDLNKVLPNLNAPAFFKNTHCQICEFQDSCLEKLIERDDLSLLTGLKPQEILQRNNRGIFSVKQLSYTFRARKNPYRKRKFLPELKALAIREGKTFIQEAPIIAAATNEIFLDIEGLPDRNFYYLIGVIIRTNGIEKTYSFWANNENDEGDIFIELISLLQSLEQFTIYHYGAYEIQAVKNIAKVLPSEYQEYLKKIIDCSFNALNIFAHNIYPPTYSNGLKEIAAFLKFQWTEKDASGLQSVVWRCNWEITNNNEFKNKLITYNIEDCKALKNVKDWICTIPKSGGENFENAEKFNKDSIYKWSNKKFIVDELVQINSFAYFNYQREKILVKTYPKIAKQQKLINSRKQKINKNFKPNKIIEILGPTECSGCKGLKFNKHDKSLASQRCKI